MTNGLQRARALAGALLITTMGALTACADARLRELDKGIATDSMLKVVGQGGPAGDSLPNIYRHAAYVVEGKILDVYYFDAEGRKYRQGSEVAAEELVPIVLYDGKLEGWGWKFLDQRTRNYAIQARADLTR
jgi:hypothetical protein